MRFTRPAGKANADDPLDKNRKPFDDYLYE